MNSLLHSGGNDEGDQLGEGRGRGHGASGFTHRRFRCHRHLVPADQSLVRKPELYAAPVAPCKAPPLWIRGILCLTCTGVSFAHGSNDGQKGMGLFMLILVAIVPGLYALNLSTSPDSISQLIVMSSGVTDLAQKHASGVALDKETAANTLAAYTKANGIYSDQVFTALAERRMPPSRTALANRKSLTELSDLQQRNSLRGAPSILTTGATIAKLDKNHKLSDGEAGRF